MLHDTTDTHESSTREGPTIINAPAKTIRLSLAERNLAHIHVYRQPSSLAIRDSCMTHGQQKTSKKIENTAVVPGFLPVPCTRQVASTLYSGTLYLLISCLVRSCDDT